VPVLVEPQRPTALPPEPSLAHYRFRIGGTIVFLDRAAYIGRNPSRPRVLRDGLPRLVQVPSVSREVSSTHLEIRQRGASVVVTDLRSTNGTIVNIPGGTPTKLRQGESMVVTPGTLIDIGDGNLVEILPLQRR
jgi:pSer/pThr/pTyr-binding forkhead associated (FHA) protein